MCDDDLIIDTDRLRCNEMRCVGVWIDDATRVALWCRARVWVEDMIICCVVYCFACHEWLESKQMWCLVRCPNNDVLCRWQSICVCDVSFRVGVGHVMVKCDFDSHG